MTTCSVLARQTRKEGNNNGDDGGGNNDFASASGLKEKDKKDGLSVPGIQEKTSKEKMDTVAMYKQDNQICQEDKTRETSRKTRKCS